jgi:hypothetical protein
VRLRFAREKLAQQFADHWRSALWSKHFDRPDPIHTRRSRALINL